MGTKIMSAEQIVNEFLSWGDPEAIRENLRCWFDEFIMNSKEPYSEDFKQEVYFTYSLLSDMLKSMENLYKQNKSKLKTVNHEKHQMQFV